MKVVVAVVVRRTNCVGLRDGRGNDHGRRVHHSETSDVMQFRAVEEHLTECGSA